MACMGLDGSEDVVKAQNKDKWSQEQLALKQRLKIKNRFAWKLPEYSCDIIKDEYDPNVGMLTKGIVDEKSNFEASDSGIVGMFSNINNVCNSQASKPDIAIGCNDKDINIQPKRRKKVLRYIAGMHMSGSSIKFYKDNLAVAGLVICEYPSMNVVYKKMNLVELTQPYIAGFKAFREVDHLIELINDVRKNNPQLIPDVILVDGNGILHFRGFGLASHLGVKVQIPTIGITRKILQVSGINATALMQQFDNPSVYAPDYTPLLKLKQKGGFCKIVATTRIYTDTKSSNYGYKKNYRIKHQVIGAALKSSVNEQCIYVSIGHKISLNTALRVAMDCCFNYNFRFPYPIHTAIKFSTQYMREYERKYKSKHVWDPTKQKGYKLGDVQVELSTDHPMTKFADTVGYQKKMTPIN